MNHFLFLFFLVFVGFSCTRKANDNSKPTAVPIKLITHKEAIDSLRKDTTAPLQPLKITEMSGEKATAFSKAMTCPLYCLMRAQRVATPIVLTVFTATTTTELNFIFQK